MDALFILIGMLIGKGIPKSTGSFGTEVTVGEEVAVSAGVSVAGIFVYMGTGVTAGYKAGAG